MPSPPAHCSGPSEPGRGQGRRAAEKSSLKPTARRGAPFQKRVNPYDFGMDAQIFYVVVGAVAVGAFARWRGWPAPLVITLVALATSFLPFIPELDIDGHTLLSVVLPPLLYSAALDSSYVSFSCSLPQIRRLGIGLVLVTAVAVGLVAWMLMPSLTLPGALLLGAIIAPPDAVSAAAIGRKLGLPRRIMTGGGSGGCVRCVRETSGAGRIGCRGHPEGRYATELRRVREDVARVVGRAAAHRDRGAGFRGSQRGGDAVVHR